MASRFNRGAREAVTADFGVKGRRTGLSMPVEGEIPLTQDGFEDPDAYFKSPASVASARKVSRPANNYASPQRSQSLQPPSSASKRQRPANRPDVTHEIGVRGRKTGVSIVPNSRMPLGPNGMDDMDAYFLQGPASIPPVARTKRVSAIREENEDEDFDEGEDEEEDQTANYGGRGASTSRGRPRQSEATTEADEQEFEEGEEEDEDEDQQEYEEEEEEEKENENGEDEEERDAELQEYDEEEQGEQGDSEDEADDPDQTVSSVGRARRQSYATTAGVSDYGDGYAYEEDDNGTQSMELENTSYFDKSTRSLASLAPLSNHKRFSGNQNATPRGANVTGSRGSGGSKSAVRAFQAEDTDSDDDETVLRSLTKSADKSRRRHSGQVSSPIADKKGKSRALFHDDSDGEGHDEGQQLEYNDDFQNQNDYGYPDDQDSDGGEDDMGGYNDYQAGEEQDEEVDENVYGQEQVYQNENGNDEDEDGFEDMEEEEPQQASKRRPAAQKRKRDERSVSQQPIIKPSTNKRKRYSYNTDGLRRSGRDVTKPVEYWRNEHVIYRRRDSGTNVYYEKIGVAERPKAPTRSLVHKNRAASRGRSVSQAPSRGGEGRAKVRSASAVSTIREEDEYQEQGQDWSKWDEETDPDGIVWDYVEGKEVKKRVAFTKAMLDPKPTKNHAYKFQRIFTDGEFMAGGVLVIPPNEAKPLKPARDNTYMLYCAQGAVRVLVHRTEFSIAQGGYFLVPRGNSYQINNLTDVDAVLVFMQAREVAAIVEPDTEEPED